MRYSVDRGSIKFHCLDLALLVEQPNQRTSVLPALMLDASHATIAIDMCQSNLGLLTRHRKSRSTSLDSGDWGRDVTVVQAFISANNMVTVKPQCGYVPLTRWCT